MKIKSLLILSVLALGLGSCSTPSTTTPTTSTTTPTTTTTTTTTTTDPTVIEVKHAVSITASTHFDITSDVAEALEGTKVTITLVAKVGISARIAEVSVNGTAITKESDLVYSFTMPNVDAVVSVKSNQVFSITATEVVGATVTPSVTTAIAGEKVGIAIVVGEVSKKVIAVTVNGVIASQETGVNAYSFLMPAENATILVALGDNVKVVPVQGDANVTVDAPATAIVGSEVVYTLNVKNGYAIATNVVKSGDTTIATTALSLNVFKFIMPDGNLSIAATSVAAVDTVLTGSTFKGTYAIDDGGGWGSTSYYVSIEFFKGYAKLITDIGENEKEYFGIYTLTGTSVEFATKDGSTVKKLTFVVSGEGDATTLKMEQNFSSYVTTKNMVMSKVITQYDISSTSDANVRVTDLTTAAAPAGKEVKFKTKYDAHYMLATGKVTTVPGGVEVALTAPTAADGYYSFIMPASNVKIIFTSQHNGDLTYAITNTIVGDENVAVENLQINGHIALSNPVAYATDEITFAVKVPANLSLKSVEVKDADGNVITSTLTAGKYKFTMPAKAVVINIVTEAKAQNPYGSRVYTAKMDCYDPDNYPASETVNAKLTFSTDGNSATLIVDGHSYFLYDGVTFTDYSVNVTANEIILTGTGSPSTLTFTINKDGTLKLKTQFSTSSIESRATFTLKV